jgi:hypothetical protein
VKAFLEGLGFAVKGEVGGCDVVGVRPGEEPILVIAELKQSFTLELVLQAVDRAPAADEVWLAAKLSARGRGREADARFRNLCRRLGFGLLGVTAAGKVEVLVDPSAWSPRRDRKRRSRLVAEHERRRGDPSAGGSTRQPIMTAYRQRALLCAALMARAPQRPRDLKPRAEDAAQILQRNVYGWFERVERGLYGLTPAGHAALARWPSDPAAEA